MDSRAVLVEALRQFEGSIVFISHDRHLINAIGTKVVEIRAGQLTAYPGDWEYYRWKKAQEEGRREEDKTSVRPEGGKPALADGKKSGSPEGSGYQAPVREPRVAEGAGLQKPHSYAQRKDLQRRYRQVEKRILELEDREASLAAALSDSSHACDYELLVVTSEELRQVREELDELNRQWEELADQIAMLE